MLFPAVILITPLQKEKNVRAAILSLLLVAGCTGTPHARYFTSADIALRAGQDDESHVIARLPRGTEVTPAGQVGSECSACWKVKTPAGTGWVYTTYLTARFTDITP
jgi:uncharacterized protein YraI